MDLSPEAVIGIFVGLLIAIDKGGYYLKRKGQNGKQSNDIAEKLIEKLDEKAKNGSAASIPGHSTICIRHGEAISEIKTELPYIKTGIEELKNGQTSVNAKVDEILSEVRDVRKCQRI